ncbi:uncharacterized protein BCR38DRAFT_482327 [Pseudomassariella vexata]|uniref:Uncharacterized protein n=1 Tax=Pseudomassariella vexata TaxID=1141098 RepID=A0A1Y2EBB7_9PEZI|nr:uncharacterized protein BCR38DRAFT_482327 [Pseudomassariella vexata]ORY68858.1 hypothetical protein BCR38DRAFT_482327 [Pseudomassariella vexata]
MLPRDRPFFLFPASCSPWILTITPRNPTVRLKSLELTMGPYDDEGDVNLTSYLEQLPNTLEDLFAHREVSVWPDSPTDEDYMPFWDDIWDAIQHQRATLRRMVLQIKPTEDWGHSWKVGDVFNLGLPREDGFLDDPLSGFDLEFEPFTKKETLKTLHIRAPLDMVRKAPRDDAVDPSAERPKIGLWEFYDLANWIFGPEGIPSLDLLVYGDFTGRGWTWKQSDDIFFIRRRRRQQQPLREEAGHEDPEQQQPWDFYVPDTSTNSGEDATLNKLIVDNFDFLEALPLKISGYA